jgi:hypothetical protein
MRGGLSLPWAHCSQDATSCSFFLEIWHAIYFVVGRLLNVWHVAGLQFTSCEAYNFRYNLIFFSNYMKDSY